MLKFKSNLKNQELVPKKSYLHVRILDAPNMDYKARNACPVGLCM